MLEAVFFDVDGTLVDDDADWRSSVKATADVVAERHRIDRAGLLTAYYTAATQVWRTIRDARSPPWGNMDEPSVVREVWRSALAECSVAGLHAAEHAASVYVRQRCARAAVFADVRDCLVALRAKYRLGVITNGSNATHLPKIEAASLNEYFESVTTTDCGSGKPLPAIFGHALASPDAEPAHSVYVGDSLSWDIGGANRVGMVSIWLNRSRAQRGVGDPVPRAEVASLHELPNVLSRLSA